MVNGRPVQVQSPTVEVSELKALACIPEHEKLYNREGRVLQDVEVVPAEHAEYGAVTDWTRGRF